MSNYHKDVLFEVIKEWDNAQLDAYIKKLELQVEETKQLLTELRQIRKKRQRKLPVDSGTRSGE